MTAPPPRDESALIRTALDSIGFNYRMELFDDGQPYAIFSLDPPEGGKLQTVVTIQGQALRINVRGVAPGPPFENHLWIFNSANAEWLFGRAYFNDVTGQYDASIGLYLGDGVPSPDAMRATLYHLAEAATDLGKLAAPYFLPPPATPLVALSDVAAILRKLGVAHDNDDPEVLHFPVHEPGGITFHLELFVVDGLLLGFRGVRGKGLDTKEDLASLEKLQSLNSRLSMGTAVLQEGAQRVYYQLVVPAAWSPLDENLVRRMVDQTRLAMREIARIF